jgi:hypothetical protein
MHPRSKVQLPAELVEDDRDDGPGFVREFRQRLLLSFDSVAVSAKSM